MTWRMILVSKPVPLASAKTSRISADSASRSSFSRSMRLMKACNCSLAKAVLDIYGNLEFQKPRKLARPRWAMQTRLFLWVLHVGQSHIQYRFQARRKFLCQRGCADQVLAHLDQHMGQAALRAVLVQGVAFQRAGIGLVVAHGAAGLSQAAHQGQRKTRVAVIQ